MTILDGQATGTIRDNDLPAGPTLSIADGKVTEGSRRRHKVNLVFTVSLSQVVGGKVTVHFATADGTAVARSDYVAKSGVLTIRRGHLTGKITIKVKSDRLVEPDETLPLILPSPVRATIADGQATGTIINDD